MSGAVIYPAVRVDGGLLPGGLLQRIGHGDRELPGMDPAAYGLQSGESVRRYANRSFAYLQEVWRDFSRQRERAGDGAPARLTRERWLLVLLRELGFDPLTPVTGGIAVDELTFPVSHRWDAVPVHLLGWGVDLDRRTARVRGAAGAAPHSMVQQLLNRSDRHLWAVLSNGQKLRLLRDSTTLVGSASIEFDLEAIFDGELFADFVLLYRLAHASRMRPADPAAGPASCVLEQWRAAGAKQGERALEQLRDGVERALEILGTGLLTHPENAALRGQVADATLRLEDVKRSLLRMIYRLLFWFVAEDRDSLLDPQADAATRRRYATFFSAARLRDLAVRRRHSRHGDLWEAVRLVFDSLGREAGQPRLGLPGIGGLFEPGPLDRPLAAAKLSNRHLLEAVEALAVLPQRRGGGRQRVDFRHLGAEELGSVYESLLELRPRWDASAWRFGTERLAGNERKTTGSYYTPSSLVESLLESALDPLIDEACDRPTAPERVAALLELTVCDPACGSGHFLIAAARRIAKRVAAEETDELEPTPLAVRSALRRVIGRCIYGVDVNEMAAELAKVSLWLEAMEPGRPLGYLDANIRVGNSLLGVTPRLLADGIPDAAFTALTGDDKKVATALKKQNAAEAGGQTELLWSGGVQVGNATLAEEAAQLTRVEPGSLADVHVQAKRAQVLEQERRHARLVADAWCAAFVQAKTPDSRGTAITQAVLERLGKGEASLELAAVEDQVERLHRQFRFFHWHIEFPHIFRVPDHGPVNDATGWQGGFSCVLGNPPWEKVEFKEQEFFAAPAPHIANATHASARKKAIAALEHAEEPSYQSLYRDYLTAVREVEAVSHMIRSSGRYPLTGQGRLNTYAMFAESSRIILAPAGQLGMIVPTGIATDATTQDFFKDLVRRRSLVSLFDFENEDRVFQGVHNQFRFSLLTVASDGRPSDRVSLVFRVRQVDQIARRAYVLSPEEISLLNPNTGTCPVFLSRRDAEITLGIYRRVPILWDEAKVDGNPWGVSFSQGLFNMATDSGLFRGYDDLVQDGWVLEGNHFVRGGERMLPLYEAKMAHFYDHRFGTYEGATQAQLNKGNLPRFTDANHDNPGRLPLPRYWVPKSAVDERLAGRWSHGWLLGWRDIARSTDERTLIPALLPLVAVGHTTPLVMSGESSGSLLCLLANLSGYCIDYVARQKVSGTHLTYSYIKQFPVIGPGVYCGDARWDSTSLLQDWIAVRVNEVAYTAYDMRGISSVVGDAGQPFRWDPQRRELLRAELDAAYFHLYGVDRDDVDYIMETFKVVREKDERAHGEFRTKRLILERYDAMADAIRTGTPYQTPLDPSPGQGPRHSAEGANH
ncbi:MULTISPECIES: Eco57I restriction-modification methylase domain-containing protein [unclassified Micromonospora]|uniref:Eco57I restriction-modification methylase domain-containing protein n=1 Tax=unclassified Micromonospora TaxID=2617518 RepID=UPI003A8C295E